MPTRYEWAGPDFAVRAAGGGSVPIDAGSSRNGSKGPCAAVSRAPDRREHEQPADATGRAQAECTTASGPRKRLGQVVAAPAPPAARRCSRRAHGPGASGGTARCAGSGRPPCGRRPPRTTRSGRSGTQERSFLPRPAARRARQPGLSCAASSAQRRPRMPSARSIRSGSSSSISSSRALHGERGADARRAGGRPTSS